MIKAILGICFSVSCLLLSAQVTTDSLQLPSDSLRVMPQDREAEVDTNKQGFFKKVLNNPYPNPERAALLSFVLPGAGQIYNRRFWYLKVPVIYGGMGFLIVQGQKSVKLRNRFQDAWLAALNGETHEFTNTRFDNTNTLRINRDRLDKNYQLSFIGLGLLHIVQTLEAYTTSHLLNFDMDESLTIGPTIIPADPLNRTGSKIGLGITVPLGR